MVEVEINGQMIAESRRVWPRDGFRLVCLPYLILTHLVSVGVLLLVLLLSIFIFIPSGPSG